MGAVPSGGLLGDIIVSRFKRLTRHRGVTFKIRVAPGPASMSGGAYVVSEYIEKVKEIIKPEVKKYNLKILPRGKSSFSILKDNQIYMTVRDTGDNMEISFGGKKYLYDKYYTKPEHLAQTIINVLEAQLAPKKEE